MRRRHGRGGDGLFKRRGIWTFYYPDSTKKIGYKQQSTGTRIYMEAQTFKKDSLRDFEEGKLPTSMAQWPLAEAGEAWIASRKNHVSDNTTRTDKERFRALSKNLGPSIKLSQITSQMIEAYQNKRFEQGAGPRTINIEVFNVLSQILRKSKLWGRISDDVKRLREPKKEIGQVLTEEQERKLFLTARKYSRWQVAYCASVLEATTASRGCEIKTLRLKSIDLTNETITIQREGTKIQAGARVVPLTPSGLEVIRELLERAEALGASDPNHFLLPAYPKAMGEPFDPMNHQKSWRSAWRSLTKEAGLKGLRGHDLRHHSATKLLEAGTPDQVVMDMAGWVNRDMLRHYSHIRMNSKRQAVKKLDLDYLGKQSKPEVFSSKKTA